MKKILSVVAIAALITTSSFAFEIQKIVKIKVTKNERQIQFICDRDTLNDIELKNFYSQEEISGILNKCEASNKKGIIVVNTKISDSFETKKIFCSEYNLRLLEIEKKDIYTQDELKDILKICK